MNQRLGAWATRSDPRIEPATRSPEIHERPEIRSPEIHERPEIHEERSPEIHEEGELLEAWRSWAAAENPADDEDPAHFDWSVLITATDFGSAGWGNDGPEGLCRELTPAAIVNERGHFVAKLLVHELGHALSLGHVDARDWIMNPAPGTGWASSTSDDLLGYFGDEPACLLDWRTPPSYEGIPVISREDQCQSRFSLPECPTQDAQANCERLVCETDTGCKWDDSPPLDGTSCGQAEHCISGTCVPI